MSLSEMFTIGAPCHIVFVDNADSALNFNGTVHEVNENEELISVLHPDGRKGLSCPLSVKLGHATENVATQTDFEAAAARGRELYPESN